MPAAIPVDPAVCALAGCLACPGFARRAARRLFFLPCDRQPVRWIVATSRAGGVPTLPQSPRRPSPIDPGDGGGSIAAADRRLDYLYHLSRSAFAAAIANAPAGHPLMCFLSCALEPAAKQAIELPNYAAGQRRSRPDSKFIYEQGPGVCRTAIRHCRGTGQPPNRPAATSPASRDSCAITSRKSPGTRLTPGSG